MLNKELALRIETKFYTDKQATLFLTFLAIYYFIGLLINKEMETDLFSILIEYLPFYSKRGWKSTQSTTPVSDPGPHQKLKLCQIMEMSSQELLEQII